MASAGEEHVAGIGGCGEDLAGFFVRVGLLTCPK